MPEAPPVPLTLDGSSMLHQMFRFDWKSWRKIPAAMQERFLEKALEHFVAIEQGSSGCQTALFSQLGHKGDLMLLYLRSSLEELNRVEIELTRLELFDFLEPRHSYVSVVELGLYESSAKTYAALLEQGHAPHSSEWNDEITRVMARQSAAMAPRLFPSVPGAKYLCFYPMDRRRGEQVNWYTIPMAERQRMMHDHGMIGRRYAGEVRQIISGSIGFDDWEWGVDLFADDPLVFKKLIYEMRFDEASALYALFGPFYIGVRLPVNDLGSWLGLSK